MLLSSSPGPSWVTRHGRKSGWLRHLYALGLMHAGMLRAYTEAGPVAKGGRTVFVCKGNVARSAYAAQRALKLGWLPVTSAGLAAGSGAAADPMAVAAAAARGVDLSRHRAQRVDELRLRAEDCVFAFEIWQARALAQRWPGRVFLLGAWAQPARPHIEDPYGRSRDYYDECFSVIDSCLERLPREQVLS